jgi:HSP20 family protein
VTGASAQALARTIDRRCMNMTIVRRASPLGELVSLRQAMDRLFEDSYVRPRTWAAAETAGLPLDVTNGPDSLIVEASLPGIRPEDVEITVEDGTLYIHGTSQTERTEGEGDALVREIRRGSVSRTVTLPTGLEAENAVATFEHGVLHLRIPKAEAVKPRQIRITPSTEAPATPVAGTTEPASMTEQVPVGAGNGTGG